MGYKGKRFLDVVVSILLLVFLSPLFLLIALAVKFFSGGPVIYRGERVGLGGRPFMMFKFRSMINNAEVQERAIFSRVQNKPINDLRVTRIGIILRKTSLDELPQLINVIKGEMSIVGSRPMSPWLAEKMTGSRKQIYFSLPPGITGIAQATNRLLPMLSAEYEELEFYYFSNCSVWLDLKIFLKTIPMVISCRGAR